MFAGFTPLEGPVPAFDNFLRRKIGYLHLPSSKQAGNRRAEDKETAIEEKKGFIKKGREKGRNIKMKKGKEERKKKKIGKEK